MDAPPIEYIRTSDGYDIAYCVAGGGEPIVFLPVGMTHLQLIAHDPRLAPWFEEIARFFNLIRYDSRGQGMSTRRLKPNHAISDLELDLEAVVDRLGLSQFVAVGYFYSGHVAVRYAAKHPERVKALVLISCSLSMSAWPLAGMMQIAEINWEGFLHTWVPATYSAAERQELVDYFKKARDKEDWLISARAFSVSDVTDDVANLTIPTLVLHPRDFLWLPPEESMKVAASINGAKFTLLDGLLPLGSPGQSVGAIRSFMENLEPSTSGEGLSSTLSERQWEVLRLIAEGRTNREIASLLTISLRTVERHVEDIYAKIGARNRAEATAYALHYLSKP